MRCRSVPGVTADAVDDWDRAGLLDGPAEDDQEALLAYLVQMGATVEQMADAHRSGNLHGLAGDLLLMTGPYSGAQLAAHCHRPWDEMAENLRQVGLDPGDPDDCRYDDADLALWGVLADTGRDSFGGAGDEMLRVLGTTMARLAEAGVASFVQDIEASLDDQGASRLELARTVRDTVEVAIAVGPLLGALLRHHVWLAISRQRRQSGHDPSRATLRVGVGFVDLVGFTPLSRSLGPAELVALLNDFDSCAQACITAEGGRVVKHLGDAVMFVADDATAACRQANGFMGAFADRAGTRPRGGVAAGEVLFRHGDYYGPVVNLAARLADQAVPGELLVDDVTAEQATGLTFEPAGRRELKGFDNPVRVLSLTDPAAP